MQLTLFSVASIVSLIVSTTQQVAGAALADHNRFLVTGQLPNITGHTPVSYAGNLPINKDTPDLELFFWYFKPPKPSDELIFWFNGGPGCSSMNGLFEENGPWTYSNKTGKFEPNPYSWHKLGHIVYVDQPLSVGLSLSNGSSVVNENDVARDFYGFLQNFLDTFPDLRSKDLHLTGESYAGYYVPYMAQYIVQQNAHALKQNKINLHGIGIGNPLISNSWWIGLISLYDNFGFWGKNGPNAVARQQYIENLKYCNLTIATENDFISSPHYDGKILSIDLPNYSNQNDSAFCIVGYGEPAYTDPLSLLNNITCLNPYDWDDRSCFDLDIPVESILNDPAARQIIHAKPVKDGIFSVCPSNANSQYILPNFTDNLPTSHVLFDGLIKSGVKVVVYSGDRDTVVDHYLTEATLQATTWGGKTGFKSLPMKPWSDSMNQTSGLVITDRGLTYVLVKGAGHMVPEYQPVEALAVLSNFILSPLGH